MTPVPQRSIGVSVEKMGIKPGKNGNISGQYVLPAKPKGSK